MAESLVLGNLIELAGNTPSQLPQCAGAVFTIGGGAGEWDWNLGSPQPVSDIIGSLILDGSRPFGRRADNRTITLPVLITAPDLDTLAGARETLLQVVDQPSWDLTWTRDGGLPLVLDCFRAGPTAVTYSLTDADSLLSRMVLSFEALPYGRTDLPVQLAFASPVQGGIPAPPAPAVLDSFASVSGVQCVQSTQHITGPFSCHWDPSRAPANNPTGEGIFFTYSAACQGGPVDVTGRPSVTVTAGFGSDFYWAWQRGRVLFEFILTDASGHDLSFGVTRTISASNDSTSPSWTKVTAAIPQGKAGFDYAHVASYTVKVFNRSDRFGRVLHHTHCYLDSVTANPQSTSQPASVRGAVYTLHGIQGSAHAPLSLSFQQPAAPVSKTVVLTGSGTWIPPAGVTSVLAECTGGGGAGSALTATGPGGGGGGAEYAAATYALTSSSPVPYSCGAAGQPAGTGPTTVTFAQDGTASWLCPPGVTSVTAACWGGGAGGAAYGGGGGGGEYASQAVTVVPGITYQVVVGIGGHGSAGSGAAAGGDSTFTAGSTVVRAHGGHTTSDGGYFGGAGGSGSTNTSHHNGGGGGTSPNSGGGGGGSGGTSAAGNVGASGSGSSGGAGATAVTGGGPGGAGTGNTPGNAPASGPGGGGGSGTVGGDGWDGQVTLTYTVAAGAPVNGGTTTFGTGASQITAHGGASAALNSGTGAAGGTGSSAAVHFDGGAGFTSSSGGGGGGSSAGSGGAGAAATSATGALPPAGGGKGGAGGAAGNNPGMAGFAPGGGGGGASSSGSTMTGGSGGAGQITLTYTATLAPFKTVLAHRPGPNSPASLTPFVSTASTTDPPDGREYAVPSLTPGVNARFGGTYSLLLVAYSWNNPSAARTVTLTVHQYDFAGGPKTDASVSRTFTPSTDVVNGILTVGELTLPSRDLPPVNTSAYFTVSISDSNISDRFLDALFIDGQGQTCLINSTVPYVNMYLDAPSSDRDLGRVMGSAFDRSEAVSVMDSAFVSGGPLRVDPGDCQILCYSVEGAPAVGASYYAAYWLDRTQ